MSDGKTYDGSKVRAKFNGREVTGVPASVGHSAPEVGVFEPLLAPEIGQQVDVIREDGTRDPRRVVSRRMGTTADGQPAVICGLVPMETP